MCIETVVYTEDHFSNQDLVNIKKILQQLNLEFEWRNDSQYEVVNEQDTKKAYCHNSLLMFCPKKLPIPHRFQKIAVKFHNF